MTPELSIGGLVVVAAVAVAAPPLIGLAPRLRVPAVVLEIVAGIVVGPSVLGLVRLDLPLQVLALIGLAFSLFLAGLEIDFERLRGPVLGLAGAGFALSFGLALGAGFVLKGAGLAESGLFLAIVLSATSLGVLIPTLKDSRRADSPFGQLLIVAASLADFSTIILLTLFFSRDATEPTAQLLLVGGLVVLGLVAVAALRRVERSMRLTPILLRLQDTTAQIRVRGAVLLLVMFAALAERLGLEVILGAFIAGAVLKLVDRDEMLTHPGFRTKLEAVGFGVFIPFFFIASGVRFDLDALVASASTLARVPVFLVALLVVRGLPALLYRPLVGARPAVAAGLLQATTLSFVVVSAQIGMELGAIDTATGAALVAAALLSVLLFPAAALSILAAPPAAPEPAAPPDAKTGIIPRTAAPAFDPT